MDWRTFLLPKLRALVAVAAFLTGSFPILGWLGGGLDTSTLNDTTRTEGTGFAFYSKLPIRSHEIIRCSDIEFPLLVARVETPNGEVTAFAVHPLPPVTSHWSKALDETMSVLSHEVSKTTGPVVVAGDFNATRWSHKSAPLRNAGLKDASYGKAPGATWMRSNPILSIPIDRLLYRGEGMRCHRFEIGPELGSDHRPVIAEFCW